jgi:hypothetical protein
MTVGYVEPDVISEEERAIQMGEVTPEKEPEKEPEGTGTLEADKPVQETEKPAEEAAATETKPEIKPEELTDEEKQAAEIRKEAESMGFKVETDKKGRNYFVDEEGTKIPEARFSKIYGKSKEAERLTQELTQLKEKNDLRKRIGDAEYFNIYPDEAPQGWKPQEPERKPAPAPADADVMNLKFLDGPYKGYTVEEVMDLDRNYAVASIRKYEREQHEAQVKQRDTETQAQRAQRDDATRFGNARAKELFGAEDAEKLEPAQKARIAILADDVLNWQAQNNCLHYSWEDAYKLMTYEERVRKAGETAAANAIKGLKVDGPRSIDTGGGGAPASVWEKVAGMTPAQLEAHIDKLDDAGLTKFLTEAPASIRAKHPSFSWR